MRRLLACLGFVAFTAAAAAQPVATMRLTADGQPSVTVARGTPVHLDAIVSWTLGPQTGGAWNQNIFCAMQGDIVVDGHAGSPANFTSNFQVNAITNLGAFVRGSRLGIDVAWTNGSFWGTPPYPPSFHSAGVLMGAYDLTLNDPGVYHVNWQPGPTWSSLVVYPNWSNFNFAQIPTTYVSATITVTPAPGCTAPLLIALGSIRGPRTRTGGTS